MHKVLTPPQLAERYGVSVDKITGWIRSGELVALNLAAAADGKRPRYKITEEAVSAFEAAREVTPPTAVAPRRKKTNLPAGFVRHFRGNE